MYVYMYTYIHVYTARMAGIIAQMRQGAPLTSPGIDCGAVRLPSHLNHLQARPKSSPETRNPQPEPRNPGPKRQTQPQPKPRNPNSGPRNPNSNVLTRNPARETCHPQPQPRQPAPRNPDPNPRNPDPKPETRDPNSRNQTHVQALVDDATSKGARVLTGGFIPGKGTRLARGQFYPPTLLVDDFCCIADICMYVI